MDDNINNIATDMRMLAAEIGGDHHSNKEAEKLLLDLAKRLDKVGYDTILLIDRTFRDSMLLTGHSMHDIDLIKRQNAIRDNSERII